ncbi:MAG: hypothetical protein RLZ12_75 [Bacillota bacterium]|jgi:hypothetical protein
MLTLGARELWAEVELEQLLKVNYNLRIKQIDHLERGIKVTADLGNFLLEPVASGTEDKWQIVSDLYQHVAENAEAFFQLHSPRITCAGKPYFHGYHGTYLLLPWLNGEPFYLTKKGYWGRVACSLAQFHMAGKGFKSSSFFSRKATARCWKSQWQTMLQKLELYRLSVGLAAVPSSFDKMWTEQFDYIFAMLEDALKYYDKQGGDKTYRSLSELCNICYGNVREKNLWLMPKGELRFLNWSNVYIDLRAQDIKDLLIYAYGRTGSKSLITYLLKSYTGIYQLKEKELHLIYAAMLYPERIMALLDAVYNREMIAEQDALMRLTKVLQFEERKLKLLRIYKEIVNKELGLPLSGVRWVHKS